ncbi:hypothetical protein [Piscinibacter gummiphilus]|uniref:Uncharacterized protein n=1 Tax=Piscinibacter gummiphilus TaxID=946333 RepID=A0A1W6LB10_9BURK|nr:hypothetical protein [Piscinibacter gummiphilus]ARN21410.1 hypothetical protein A4W93_16730 [Piscinibacter gummiphilus]ATU66093.1 hypothetical protein CPZ87_16820 [Piscinibacter gummiphilus]GLS96240.1 hypothetical protein GCM10007918_35320 [Piscinibacter gummiphilus]
MVELKRAVIAALVLALGLGAPPVRAIVFIDPVNLIQNIISAMEAIEQVHATYTQIQVQVQQAQAMARQLKSMDPSQIAGVLGDITGREELLRLERALAANRDLIGSLNTIRQGFDERLDTARLMKLTWHEYVAWERNRIARKEESALARVQAEAHAMKRIEADYDFAREQAQKIPQSSGTHEAVQQMNVQMNRVIQQNAELLRQFSTAMGRATAEREMQEAEDSARAKAQEDAWRAAVEAARRADRQAIDAWNRGRRP